MNRFQSDVAAFNEAVDAVRGDTPALRDTELRARLILEEAFETAEAMVGCSRSMDLIKDVLNNWETSAPVCEYPDMVEAIDGLCDLLYVAAGAFDAFGINAEPFFAVVHEANMTKLTGPKDEHGKQQKPPGFVPPQEKIRALLIAAGWKP